jgi:ATP synthase subunit 6
MTFSLTSLTLLSSPLNQFEVLLHSPSAFAGGGLYSSLFFALLFFAAAGFLALAVLGGSLLPESGASPSLYGHYLLSALVAFPRANGEASLQPFAVFFAELALAIGAYNLSGLLPLGFTLTSHIFVTFFFSLSVFMGLNTLAIFYRRWNFLENFIPAGTLFALVPLLVFLETVSYFSRLFSLAIRLFANMMAGHALLKIFISFIYLALGRAGFSALLALGGLAFLTIILAMELAVSLLQLYVFLLLTFIYSAESLGGH